MNRYAHSLGRGVPHDGSAPRERPQNKTLSYKTQNAEAALVAALDSAERRARGAVEAEDFEGAMTALASPPATIAFAESHPGPDGRSTVTFMTFAPGKAAA